MMKRQKHNSHYMHMYTIELTYTYTKVLNNMYYYIQADHQWRFEIK